MMDWMNGEVVVRRDLGSCKGFGEAGRLLGRRGMIVLRRQTTNDVAQLCQRYWRARLNILALVVDGVMESGSMLCRISL